MAARYVTIAKAAELTGYTARAIQTKIDRGIWLEGHEYRRAPDNRILIDLVGYEKWVEHQALRSTGERSGSTSGMEGDCVASH